MRRARTGVQEPMPLILSQLIEACRWLGALAVLALHATNMFVNLGDIMSAPHAAPVYAWWFFTAAAVGHQAVVGFFVLSGWLVGGAVLARMRKEQDYLRDYLIHRFSRIYLVLIPALLLTLVADQSGRWLFSGSGVYGWPMFDGRFSLKPFLGSLLNLQSIAVDYFGTNGPLWSLACEFWYYITFPLLLLPFARNYSAALRFGGFAVGAVIFIGLALPTSWFKFGYILWAMGAFATLAPRAVIRNRGVALALHAALLIVIRLVVRGPLLEAHPSLSDLADLSSAALFVNLLLAFRDGPADGFRLLRPKLHKTLADFSFSLYAIHMPLLILARAAAGQIMGNEWTTQFARPQNFALCLAVMATAIASAYGFSRFTEAKTGAARRYLRGMIDKVAPAS